MPGPPIRCQTGAEDDGDALLEDEALRLEDNDEEEDVLADTVELDVQEAAPEAADGRNVGDDLDATWLRPPVEALDPVVDALVFQQLEVDYCLQPSPSTGHAAPVLRMFGTNDAGNSVCLLVHGFEPYFYADAPPGLGPEDCGALARALQEHPRLKPRAPSAAASAQIVTRVEVVTRTSVWGYQPGGPRPFLRVACSTPSLVAAARAVFESGGAATHNGRPLPPLATHESNVPYALRFMVDAGLVGGGWAEVPAGAWWWPPPPPGGRRVSHCQIEAHCRWDAVVAHAAEGEWARVAPLRSLSFDIECAGRRGLFPEPQHDPVIQIAAVLSVAGEPAPRAKVVLTLGSCSPLLGAQVLPFGDEPALLRRWARLLRQADPDIVLGYNVVGFDLPYLFDRAAALGLGGGEAHAWGRVRGSCVRARDATFSSKAYGTRAYREVAMDGRVTFDAMVALQREHKLSSYSLNAVSAHFLGEQKEDVHHSAIADLQAGDAETRRRLAAYCLKDALLPQRLADKLQLLVNLVEMARVTGVPPAALLARGQSFKVFSQLLRKGQQRGFVVPYVKSGGGGDPADGGGPVRKGSVEDASSYEGATVLEPKVGLFNAPVATLDFASLYPSIMMAHNLCYSTLVLPGTAGAAAADAMPPSDVASSPTGDRFVLPSVRRGVLPEILAELLAARARARAELKRETDPFRRAVLDGRQLALKVTANSVYGFTGATVGKMPCLAISAAVTAYGRAMIEDTRSWVEAELASAISAAAAATDCQEDSAAAAAATTALRPEVIYGDTDSVMVHFGPGVSVGAAMELGRRAAELVSARFPPPVRLEFEKVYAPFLLMAKKRYAGLLWTRPDGWDRIDAKGIETVRRDNCGLVRQLVAGSLHRILVLRDAPGAVAYAKAAIADLLTGRVDMSLLVVSKALATGAADYKVRAAHVELAERMRKRDPATAPAVGDRVPYVIVKAGGKGAKACDKAEDPLYALENNLLVDAQHYLDHHLSAPLLRIFGPVCRDARAELLSGVHTRTVAMATPSAATRGIMRFAKVKASCIVCRAALSDAEAGSVCVHCKSRKAEVLCKGLARVSALEAEFGKLWTQCQRCQGSLHQDVLCSSRDCPLFYRRRKVAKDLGEAHAFVARQ